MAAITYDQQAQTIQANGRNVVDLSSVKNGSKAILYSKAAEQGSGFETTFCFDGNRQHPFSLAVLPLTPANLIRAIIENKLHIEGLVCSEEISVAYKTIIAAQQIDIFSN